MSSNGVGKTLENLGDVGATMDNIGAKFFLGLAIICLIIGFVMSISGWNSTSDDDFPDDGSRWMPLYFGIGTLIMALFIYWVTGVENKLVKSSPTLKKIRGAEFAVDEGTNIIRSMFDSFSQPRYGRYGRYGGPYRSYGSVYG